MHAIAELESAARTRLPRRVFDFIAGGAGGESALRNNRDAFDRIRLIPRTMVNIQRRRLKTDFLGRNYAAPFGIAPMGMCNIAWPATDRGLARAAHAAELPYCLSMAGSSALANARVWAGEHLWYQVYLCGSEDLWERQLLRAEALGIENLILTVDVPLPGRRLRDLRNGFTVPMKWTPVSLLDFALHPGWSLTTLAKGAPRMRNMESFADTGSAVSLPSILAIFAQSVHEWEVIERLRHRWKGKLLVKGVLNPNDAMRMARMGADAIVVSNHGGRQLGSAISSIEALPAVRAAVGPGVPLVLDSGIRSGEDIAKALALGADFVLAGRPFLFGSAALGPDRGPGTAIDILRIELDGALAQLGCTDPAQLSQAFVQS